MTRKRKDYFRSAEYRKSLKVGDRLIRVEDTVIGTIEVFYGEWAKVHWADGSNNSDLLITRQGAITAVRLEDLTPDERLEVVTKRIAQ